MNARCPNNPEHDQFITVAHVTEDWVVDREGNFLEEAPAQDKQTVHGPTVGNTWTCRECGADAIVTA